MADMTEQQKARIVELAVQSEAGALIVYAAGDDKAIEAKGRNHASAASAEAFRIAQEAR